MFDVSSSERAQIRRLLGVFLVSDADLSAFCIDYFPEVYRRFSDGMERTQRENLLLLHVEPALLTQALRRAAEVPGRLSSGILPTTCSSSSAERADIDDIQPPGAPFDTRWYIPRAKEEQRARAALRYRHPVVLYSPAFYGKTWLLQSILAQARRPELRIASINLALFGRTALSTLDNFLRKLAFRLCRELNLQEEDMEACFDTVMRRGGPLDALYDVMEWHILSAGAGDLLLAIDNVDLIAGQSYQDEFFGMLRAWTDNSESPFDRLRLILCISTAPVLLVKDANRSPFNVGDELVVDDFSDSQIENLADRYGLALSQREIDQIRSLVGGHPYLARTILYESQLAGSSVAEIVRQAEHDGGIFSGYLRHLQRQMDSQPELLESLARIDSDSHAAVPAPIRYRLERGGLIVRDNQTRGLRLRHRLYRRLFSC